MSANLAPVLLYISTTFAAHKIPFFLDYGTLLGAVRDHGIIPHDFDIDLGLMEEQCDRVSELKQQFLEETGYHVYDRRDYIAAKRNVILGYDAYLHSPCVRIYTEDHAYYSDVYWYRRETPESVAERRKQGLHINVPTGWDQLVASRSDSEQERKTETEGQYDLVCNDDAYETNTPGGCRYYSHTFPLKMVPLLGAELPVPANPESHLDEVFGQGQWRTPIGKGYKRIICGRVPDWQWSIWGVVGSAAAALFMLWKRWDDQVRLKAANRGIRDDEQLLLSTL